MKYILIGLLAFISFNSLAAHEQGIILRVDCDNQMNFCEDYEDKASCLEWTHFQCEETKNYVIPEVIESSKDEKEIEIVGLNVYPLSIRIKIPCKKGIRFCQNYALYHAIKYCIKEISALCKEKE